MYVCVYLYVYVNCMFIYKCFLYQEYCLSILKRDTFMEGHAELYQLCFIVVKLLDGV